MDSWFILMVAIALTMASASRRDRPPTDEARARDPWRKFATWLAPVAFGLMGVLAGILIYERTSGKKASAHIAMMGVMAFVIASAHRQDQGEVDEARAAERRRKFRTTAAMLIAPLLLVYAVMAGAMAAFLLSMLTFGHEPWTPFAVFMTLGLATASIILGLIGIVLLRDKHLFFRLGRAWAAAVEAFHAPVSDDKPKPTIDPDMD